MANLDKYERVRPKLNFIKRYRQALNASTGSEFDSNANVEEKNVATMATEVNKKDYIYINRLLMIDKLKELYGEELADKYIEQLDSHIIYKHDETSLMPYCVAITMYPWLFDGMKKLGGKSDAPKHLQSFCGSFSNLVFAIASQFAGAVATPEFLLYMDYFIRKDYGDDYYLHADDVVEYSKNPRTIYNIIENCWQQIVYTLNEPAGARNYQSPFWNISYYDKYYFKGLFEDFVFPDESEPKWESLNWLQKHFINWFNEERTKKVLTFPVETVNLLNDGEKCLDEEWADFAAEAWSKGHSFFCYTSDSVNALSSCCRLRNEISENVFSYTLGAGGISTGSKSVITMNLNRIIQNTVEQNSGVKDLDKISKAIREQTELIHKYQLAFNSIMEDNLNAGLLPVYDAGFISMEKQYLTIGVNGFVEAAEYLGIEPNVNNDYFAFGEAILKPIYELNKRDRKSNIMFNTEFVPAENLGVKHATWDKKDGYFVPRDCYNSYFFRSEDSNINAIDKMILHGNKLTKYLDGGSACHINLHEHLTKEQYLMMLNNAIKVGCSYFTYNIPNTLCSDCGNISKHYLKNCPKCGSSNISFVTRIIGYLKLVTSFSEARQKEESARYYE